MTILTSYAAGHPVYETLRKNTYWVESGTAGLVEYRGKSYLVSNWHVCRNFKNGETKAKSDYYGAEYKVKVLVMSPEHDLCIMKAPATGGLKLGKPVKYLSPVYTAGYPKSSRDRIVLSAGHRVGIEHVILDYGTAGCPSTFTKTQKSCTHEFELQDTTLLGEPGCSGSPMVNSKGELVGVFNSTSSGTLSALKLSDLYETFKLLKP